MWSRSRRYLAFLALAFWLGGLTFYSLVVVPIGSELLGASTQGFVTRQVSNWLNVAGVAAVVVVLPEIRRSGRMAFVVWLAMLVCQVALIALHPRLDALLDVPRLAVRDYDQFYTVHRVYLMVTAVQCLAGMLLAAQLWARDKEPGRS